MRNVLIRIEEESFLTLEAISECYACTEIWLQQAYDLGLLGAGREHAGRLVLNVTVLDRVAEVVRMRLYEGLEWETIVILLGEVREVRVEYVVGDVVIVRD